MTLDVLLANVVSLSQKIAFVNQLEKDVLDI